jgi:hypothetical protein
VCAHASQVDGISSRQVCVCAVCAVCVRGV